MVETYEHNGIGELGAIVDTVAFVAVHIVATSAKSKDIGTAVGVGLERIVSFGHKGAEIKDAAFAASDFGDKVITP